MQMIKTTGDTHTIGVRTPRSHTGTHTHTQAHTHKTNSAKITSWMRFVFGIYSVINCAAIVDASGWLCYSAALNSVKLYVFETYELQFQRWEIEWPEFLLYLL